MSEFVPKHESVLKAEVVKYALPEGGEVFVDATFGLGGHSAAVLEAYPDLRTVIGIDRDKEILAHSAKVLVNEKIRRYQAKASEIKDVLEDAGIEAVDGILLDLGVSSYQIDNPSRGFSFMQSGPLDMRMSVDDGITAEELVNSLDRAELERIFFEYGEERYSKLIAGAIVARRNEGRIATTEELAKLVSGVVPGQNRKKRQIHPATRVFQALRIAVNNELGELEMVLADILDVLKVGGHFSIISFHSLEDRMVKEFIQKYSKGCECPPKFPVCVCGKVPRLKPLTRRPVIATDEEIVANPRSRSAKLRSAVKIS